MNEQVLDKALAMAAQQQPNLANIVGYANQQGIKCSDARMAAAVIGKKLNSGGANENVIISEMGKAYEAVLYITMVNGNKIQVTNQQYHQKQQQHYQSVANVIKGTQEQGVTHGNGTNIYNTATPAANTNIFPAAQATQLFGTPASQAGGLFTPNKEPEPQTNLFATNPIVHTQQPLEIKQQSITEENIMESLVSHETETLLRESCVTSKSISESIALYKGLTFDEDLIRSLMDNGGVESARVNGVRTAIKLSIATSSREFEIGEDSTSRAMEALHTTVEATLAKFKTLASSEFTGRMVSDTITTVSHLVRAFKEYADNAKSSDTLNQLTVSDATRAYSALQSELYMALDTALSFAGEGKPYPNKDGTGTVNFELDYTDLIGELGDLEEFHASYEGMQSNLFELIFCQFAQALSWIDINVDGHVVTLGSRTVNISMPYPLFDGFELRQIHTSIDRSAAGENLDIVLDMMDSVAKGLPASRVRFIDGIYRSAYIDRAYNTCRPKVSLR